MTTMANKANEDAALIQGPLDGLADGMVSTLSRMHGEPVGKAMEARFRSSEALFGPTVKRTGAYASAALGR